MGDHLWFNPVLKAHPIEFYDKPSPSLWDVPSAQGFLFTSIKNQRIVLRPRVGLVWVVPLAHREKSLFR